MISKRVNLTLLIIILIAAILRIYRIDQIPPSLSWDEVAVGYNAFTIANWGKDEWGEFLPLTFKSFGDDKHPIHVYFTALSVKLFGLSDFSTRLPVAIFGVLNVIVIFFLARVIFNNEWIGLLAALFMAISPYALQFSRFNHEANFALFFFMLGLLLFFLGKLKKNFLLPLSFLSFGASLLSYHSSKVVVPPIVILLIFLYFKEFWKLRRYFIISVIILLIIGALIWLHPPLLGTARAKQTTIPKERIEKTNLFKKTNLEILGRLEIGWQRYISHLSTKYLFITGDSNSKFSIQTVGAFYKIDAIFLIIGFLAILIKKTKQGFILLSWAMLAPIPPSISGGEGEVPHAARALFMMGSWHIISALGFYQLIMWVKNSYLRRGVTIALLIVLGWLFKGYVNDYYQKYPIEEAINWQYGMKQIVEYVQQNDIYSYVFSTDIRFQPYIFFLYYLKTPLPTYLGSVNITQDLERRKYSLVTSFDKYHFGDWNPIESYPHEGVLYALTPNEYYGLKYKHMFEVKKLIHFPDGERAFYLVSKY